MKISVIIPNYNYAQYLFACLSSVLESDLDERHYEVLVVDDASTDHSVAIVRDLSFHYQKPIRIIRNPINSGLVITRNNGIKEALGEYLFFLDADNCISPSCLSRHLEMMESDPAIVACYSSIQDFHTTISEKRGIRSNAPFDYERLRHGNYIDAMAMFRADIFSRLGPYDTSMPMFGWEDYELWLRLGSHGCRVEFIPGAPLSYYRIHDSCMTRNVTIVHMHTLWKYLHERYDLYFKIGEAP